MTCTKECHQMEIKRLVHKFSDFTLDVENVALTGNKIIGLVGENGSGKTTLMSILAGFIKVNEIFDVQDYDINEVKFIPSHIGLYDLLSVYDFVQLVSDQSAKRPDPLSLLDKLQLREKKDEKLFLLSEGMQKKCSLITLFTTDYKFLILDEPFNSIDMHYVYELKKQLRVLSETATILISSHILDTLNDLCDTFVYIKDGQVVKTFANTHTHILEDELFVQDVTQTEITQ